MVPSEEGVDRFRDKEYEETPLPILPSGSRRITLTEDGIATLRCEGIVVENNNEPDPENSMQSDYVLTTYSALTSEFHGVDPWRQSGKFPVGRAKPKTTSNPIIQHMSLINFFMKLYFMDNIKNVVIPKTNKCLNLAMNLSMYFHVIGFRFIMAFYFGHYVRDFFLKINITPKKGSLIRLNYIISRRRPDNMIQVMS